MIVRAPFVALPLAAFAIAILLAGPSAALETAAEIEECVQANLPPETSVQTIGFRTHNRLNEIAKAEVKLYWKRVDDDHSKVMMRFEAPLDRRGSALLMLQKEDNTDIFMYLPELDRTRRVTGRMLEGSMFGTDFTYEQFQRLQGLAEDVSVKRLDDSTVDGTSVYVLEHIPSGSEGKAKERVLSYIEPKRCVQLRTEFFDGSDDPDKVLTVDASSIEQDGDLWIPRKMTMRDMSDQTETELHIEKIEIGVEISKKTFNQAGLSRSR